MYLSSQDLGLTRFAGNAIHQNVSHSNVTLNIRAVEGQRIGRPPPTTRRTKAFAGRWMRRSATHC